MSPPADPTPARARQDLESALGPFMGMGMTALCAVALLGGWGGDHWLLALGLVALTGVVVALITHYETRHGRSSTTEVVAGVTHLSLTAGIVAVTGGMDSPLWALFLLGALVAGLTDSSGARWAVVANGAVAGATMTGCALVAQTLNPQSFATVLVRVIAIILSGLVAREATLVAQKQAALRRQAEREKLREGEELRLLLSRVNTPMLGLDTGGRINEWNLAATELWGQDRETVVGQPAPVVLKPIELEALLTQTRSALAGESTPAQALSLMLDTGPRRVLVSATPRRDLDENLMGCWLVCQDISQLHAALGEKETLLREVHHRVKNNLQIISSLLTLQKEQATDPAVADPLLESASRVRSMALIHQQLYGADSLAHIDFGGYAEQLSHSLAGSLSPNATVDVRAEPVELTVEVAVPCGLILNELVTNALKYGASPPEAPHIQIRVAREGDGFSLTVADDGPGLPPSVDLETASTLGLELVRALTRQIRGSVEVVEADGATLRLRYPGLEALRTSNDGRS